jgi:hypothetical protein
LLSCFIAVLPDEVNFFFAHAASVKTSFDLDEPSI